MITHLTLMGWVARKPQIGVPTYASSADHEVVTFSFKHACRGLTGAATHLPVIEWCDVPTVDMVGIQCAIEEFDHQREQMIAHLTLMGWEPVWGHDTLAPWHGVGNQHSRDVVLYTNTSAGVSFMPQSFGDCAASKWEILTNEVLVMIIQRIEREDHAP